jgi:hypothetical protein
MPMTMREVPKPPALNNQGCHTIHTYMTQLKASPGAAQSCTTLHRQMMFVHSSHLGGTTLIWPAGLYLDIAQPTVLYCVYMCS